MKLQHLLVLICAWPMLVHAEIYKSVDADGHVTYSSAPIKGGKKIILDPNLSSGSTERPRSALGPENFPKVDNRTQKGRDDTRRQILEEELAAEEKLLAEANQNLKVVSPEVYRGKDGKTYRNVAKYDEKTKALNEQANLHQRNVEALKTELSRLR